jgi:plastocyanin
MGTNTRRITGSRRPHPSSTLGVALALTFALASCGDGNDGPSPGPSPNPGPGTGSVAATITITASGASPRDVTVAPGSRVTFVNNDTVAHNMHSDPHPEHTNCPALEQIGFLAAGQSKTSGNLNTAGACGFHDHDMPTVASLRGTIRVQ